MVEPWLFNCYVHMVQLPDICYYVIKNSLYCVNSVTKIKLEFVFDSGYPSYFVAKNDLV